MLEAASRGVQRLRARPAASEDLAVGELAPREWEPGASLECCAGHAGVRWQVSFRKSLKRFWKPWSWGANNHSTISRCPATLCSKRLAGCKSQASCLRTNIIDVGAEAPRLVLPLGLLLALVEDASWALGGSAGARVIHIREETGGNQAIASSLQPYVIRRCCRAIMSSAPP